MSEEFKENLSALVDGELELESARETIDVLIDSDALRVHWSRYHVVRDVLRHKAYPEAGDALRERVRASLADEPLFSSPGTDEVERSRRGLFQTISRIPAIHGGQKPEPIPVERPASRRWRGALKPVAGLALAASVAVVAVLAVRGGGGPLPGEMDVPLVSKANQANQASQATTTASLAAARGSPPSVAAPRHAAAEIPAERFTRLQWDTEHPAVASRLNGYLVNHSEYLGGAMKGMHPYARIVGYDSTGQR